jgi:flagellar hook-basal body complex protein FliE
MNPTNPNDKPSLPGDVSPTSKIEPLQPLGEDQHEVGGEKPFSAFMEEKEAFPTQGTSGKASAISPFDLVQSGIKPITTPNSQALFSQADLAHSTLNTIQTQLNHPNLKLKASEKYLVKNKLVDANTNFKAINSKLNAPAPELAESPKATGPIAQYLGYVTDGMQQIEATKQQLAFLSSKGQQMSPPDFMLVQLKLNKAQQELDFTSAVLGKSIEGVKAIMNIQI